MHILQYILYGIILGHWFLRIKQLLTRGTSTKQKWLVLARLVEPEGEHVYEVGITSRYSSAEEAVSQLDGGDFFIGELYELEDSYMAPPVCDWSELSADEQDELFIAQGLLL